MCQDATGNTDKQVLELEYENAQQRLSDQRETIQEFSNESLMVIRLVILFIAAPTAILGAFTPDLFREIVSISVSGSCGIRLIGRCLANVFHITAFTVLMLLLGTGFHTVTAGFDARGIRNITNPKDISIYKTEQIGAEEYFRQKLGLYRTRIEENDKVIYVLENFLAFGKFAFLSGVMGVAALTYILVTSGTVNMLGIILAISFFLLIHVVSRILPTPFIRADNLTFWNFTPVYDPDYKDNMGDDEETGSE